MEVASAYLPEASRQNFQIRLFSRHVDPGERAFREHRHFHFEVVLVKSGSGIYSTLRTAYDMRPGDVFLFACNEVHCVTRIDGGEQLHMMNVHIEPSFLWPESSSLLSAQFLSMPFSHSGDFENRLPRDSASTKKIARLLLETEEEFARKKSEYPLMIRSKLTELFVTLERDFNYVDESALRGRSLQHVEIIRTAVGHIRSHLTDPMTLGEIASSVRMSPNYFCSVFKQVAGVTPWEYITAARIELAMRLMEQYPDETLLTIAIRSGFNNTQNFNKMFVKHTGCTPSDYRNGGYSLPEP